VQRSRGPSIRVIVDVREQRALASDLGAGWGHDGWNAVAAPGARCSPHAAV